MVFSTRSARKGPLSAELQAWCDSDQIGGPRTVILTLRPNADVASLNHRLTELGADIVSAGAGATIATLPKQALVAACDFPGVVRIDTPNRMGLKPGAVPE